MGEQVDELAGTCVSRWMGEEVNEVAGAWVSKWMD